MLRPLAIGIPIILAIAVAFAVGMNVVSPMSPYFPYVIGGYAVLFPIALAATIIATIRSVRRTIRGGDPTLAQRGRRVMATVTTAIPSSMTMRIGGGMPLRMVRMVLKLDHAEGGFSEIKAGRYVQMWDMSGGVGSRVPVYFDPANPLNRFIAWTEAQGGEMAAGPAMPTQADLSQLPEGLQRLARMGLDLAAKAQREMGISEPAQREPTAVATVAPRGVVRPVDDAPPAPVREEGRARIEQLQPNPDGTYELDLFVTPKSRPSYRLTIALPVPPEQIGRMRRGQYLPALLDPAMPETIEIAWDKV